MAPSETERDLQRLAVELRQLEAEYNMYFAGRLPKPPWETRSRVDALIKQYDRAYILQTGRVLMQGPAADIRTNPDVRKAYLGL